MTTLRWSGERALMAAARRSNRGPSPPGSRGPMHPFLWMRSLMAFSATRRSHFLKAARLSQRRSGRSRNALMNTSCTTSEESRPACSGPSRERMKRSRRSWQCSQSASHAFRSPSDALRKSSASPPSPSSPPTATRIEALPPPTSQASYTSPGLNPSALSEGSDSETVSLMIRRSWRMARWRSTPTADSVRPMRFPISFAGIPWRE